VTRKSWPDLGFEYYKDDFLVKYNTDENPTSMGFMERSGYAS
jgi:hypothetical protein